MQVQPQNSAPASVPLPTNAAPTHTVADVPVAPVEPYLGDMPNVMELLGSEVTPEEAVQLQQEFGEPQTAPVAAPVAAPVSPAFAAPAAPPPAQAPIDPQFLQFLQTQTASYQQALQAQQYQLEQMHQELAALKAPKVVEEEDPAFKDPNVKQFADALFKTWEKRYLKPLKEETSRSAQELAAFKNHQQEQQLQGELYNRANYAVHNLLLGDRAQHIPQEKRQEVERGLRAISIAAGLALKQDPYQASQTFKSTIDAVVDAEIARRNAASRQQVTKVQSLGGAPAARPQVASTNLNRKFSRAEIQQYYGGDAIRAYMDDGRRIPR